MTQANPEGGVELREVTEVLCAQWSAFLGTRARVLRWLLERDERPWLDAFLRSRLEGSSRAYTITTPFPARGAYGHAAALEILPVLAHARVGGERWTCPRLPAGADAEVLEVVFSSFLRFLEPMGIDRIVVVLAPSAVGDNARWLEWVVGLAGKLDDRVARVILLEDRVSPRSEQLARSFPEHVHTTIAALEIPGRIVRMAARTSSPTDPAGKLRVLFTRTLGEVNAGRTAQAAALADEVTAIAEPLGLFSVIIPVRFAVGAALVNEKRHVEAVRSYALAVHAAERAEAAGQQNGRWLRIMARFGVGSAILATPQGAERAATYFAETAPLCREPTRHDLELEAHRCASAAYEIAGQHERAWDAGVRALGMVDQLAPEARKGASLISLVDALLRLTEARRLRHHRAGLEHELRRRTLRGTTWA